MYPVEKSSLRGKFVWLCDCVDPTTYEPKSSVFDDGTLERIRIYPFIMVNKVAKDRRTVVPSVAFSKRMEFSGHSWFKPINDTIDNYYFRRAYLVGFLYFRSLLTLTRNLAVWTYCKAIPYLLHSTRHCQTRLKVVQEI
jgi:hypothetical protein